MSRQSYTAAAVVLALTGTALTANTTALANTSEKQQVADAPVISVPVTKANTDDITETTSGREELADFTNRNLGEISEIPQGALKGKRFSIQASELQSEYKVLEVETSTVASELALPASACEDRDSEILVVPQSVTNISYTVGDGETGAPLDWDTGTPVSPDEDPGSPDSCNLSVEWEEAPDAEDTVQDDPEEATPSATRPYAKKIASDCFRRKVARAYWPGGGSVKTAYNDSCYQNWVEKHDGSDSWNYYSKRALSTCDRYGNFAIKSCGHGVKRKSSGPTIHWQDWAPNASQDRNDCRARSASVTLYSVSVSANFDICDKQLIHKYAEAGKMSSYWKGTARSARGTQHQVSVKTNQRQGRPKWKHWTNVGWGV
ncbi:hypothetical protein GKQ77_25005 [Streptomyces sp. BG9H]|uniref:Secreted protein n=1 Tax=Streptomyces anatolicus TaxID=2675858 RepID=A0ABS6YUM5_9ACTN|nr:hypothetical protein [Streptomyces anatolicus]